MWIKICGVTRIEDALAIRDAGADAVGLNFFAGSKRHIPRDAAQRIASALADSPVECVGVFVNAEPEIVVEIVDAVGVRCVQFHGDETIEQISAFHRLRPQIPIIRAARIDATSAQARFAEIDALHRSVPLRACLLDALVAGSYGGTGQVVDTTFARLYSSIANRPQLILAGGLTPENVADVIRQAGPQGVDTAGGVESAPGIKNVDRVRKFIAAARTGQAAGTKPKDVL